LPRSPVNSREIDRYLQGINAPERNALQQLRHTILEIIPDAEQTISYKIPAFRVDGKMVAGFAAFKHHLSYLPFSGSILRQLENELHGYTKTKSSLHFPVNAPLPTRLVARLIELRLEEAAGSAGL
jgi:uncharacterized protein YdhG (YjbR/CyaY superfamily)